ncbi:GGDEF domain-containing protein [Shewanella eurypsychrophilus]|uniref:diguanylate cyclase n=1 Tax=Shewanella eurypsychrophilus TaxID=2593656 RepID=A0ABX6V3R1_9GAMM|nr:MULTISPECIES: GGDEF domain-containing protein [Shewanella]QFU20611.1 diguanylate cyclase [Shewanella sp. YLB-09]QFU20892.1 diguanylate cyclase [Shewanella sp. YLB-09]QPG56181.1 GGDEF domain-containing protein [Shewanella eurypsychrophilus]
MSSLIQGCRYFILPLLITALTLFFIQETKSSWQIWDGIIEQLPYWLLSIAALLALQFNRSRLAYLAVLLLAFYLSQHSSAQIFLPLSQYTTEIFIGGTLVIACFGFTKDRGLLSSHGVIRGLGIAIGMGLGFLWLSGLNLYQAEIRTALPFALSQQFQIMLPVYVCSALLISRAIWQANLVNTSILTTLGIWIFYYFQPNTLPLAVLMSSLAVIYLFTILIDSYFLAYRDELTGLASRRALYNLVLSLGRKYSVAMLDIDHFKKFNDTYGHDVGDQVLRLVAAKMARVSGGGKVFRYGGEEFTIVFPRKDADSILDDLEDVRESIEEYRIVLRNDKRKKQNNSQNKAKRNKAKSPATKTVSVTISIGVAERLSGETFDQSMKRADEALYRAKKKGRNQTCL